MPAWIDAGFDQYAKRMPREYGLELIEVKPEPRDRGKSVEQMLAAETVRIRAACTDDRIVALDERGKAWTTRDVASKLERQHGIAEAGRFGSVGERGPAHEQHE